MRCTVQKIIQLFRKDTEYIINDNPIKCKIKRENPIIEDGEIVDYESSFVDDETVRIICTRLDNIINKDASGSVIETYKYLLITKWDTKIKKDDIIIDENKRIFKVESINAITHCGADVDHCYRVEVDIRLIGEE